MSCRAAALVALLVAASALTACGQKGPLFLPEADGAVITRERGEAATAPAEVTSEDGETAPPPNP